MLLWTMAVPVKQPWSVGASGCGREGYWQALPVDHVGADSVGPVHVSPDGGVRVVLMEHVVLAAPVDGAAGVVHPATGRLQVECWALRIGEGLDLR